MRFTLALTLAVAWCVTTVFILPHHRPKPDSFRKTTLAGNYREFLESLPILLRPRKQGLILLGLTGIFSSFFPPLLLIALRAGGQFLLITAGLAALTGAGVNLVLILVSHMNFMSGANNEQQTPLTWLLPLSQALIALTSIATGFSATWTSAVSQMLINPPV